MLKKSLITFKTIAIACVTIFQSCGDKVNKQPISPSENTNKTTPLELNSVRVSNIDYVSTLYYDDLSFKLNNNGAYATIPCEDTLSNAKSITFSFPNTNPSPGSYTLTDYINQSTASGANKIAINFGGYLSKSSLGGDVKITNNKVDSIIVEFTNIKLVNSAGIVAYVSGYFKFKTQPVYVASGTFTNGGSNITISEGSLYVDPGTIKTYQYTFYSSSGNSQISFKFLEKPIAKSYIITEGTAFYPRNTNEVLVRGQINFQYIFDTNTAGQTLNVTEQSDATLTFTMSNISGWSANASIKEILP